MSPLFVSQWIVTLYPSPLHNLSAPLFPPRVLLWAATFLPKALRAILWALLGESAVQDSYLHSGITSSGHLFLADLGPGWNGRYDDVARACFSQEEPGLTKTKKVEPLDQVSKNP